MKPSRFSLFVVLSSGLGVGLLAWLAVFHPSLWLGRVGEPIRPSVSSPLQASAANTPTASRPTPSAPLQKAVCTGLENGNLNARATAGTQAAIIGVFPEALLVTLTGREAVISGERWVETRLPLSGWVNARYLCGVSQ